LAGKLLYLLSKIPDITYTTLRTRSNRKNRLILTAQIGDSILIDGKSYGLCVLPLDVLFNAMPCRPYFDPPHTANWRGYVASWKIEDNRLLLVGLRGRLSDKGRSAMNKRTVDWKAHLSPIIARIESLPESSSGLRQSDPDWSGSKISDENGFADPELASNITIGQLLNSHISPVPAAWYTGLLRIPLDGELEYVHGGFHTEYEMDLIIEIGAGAVLRRWLIDNRSGREARKSADT
jgi:hypothetical protein